jgi:hypothetical protein
MHNTPASDKFLVDQFAQRHHKLRQDSISRQSSLLATLMVNRKVIARLRVCKETGRLARRQSLIDYDRAGGPGIVKLRETANKRYHSGVKFIEEEVCQSS